MKQSRSFKEYVSNRFEDAFYDAIGRYNEENIDSLDLYSRRVHRIDKAEVSDPLYCRLS